ncbi:MAG: hypothetical protein AAF616_07605 [Bacteroidota bacterium]
MRDLNHFDRIPESFLHENQDPWNSANPDERDSWKNTCPYLKAQGKFSDATEKK